VDTALDELTEAIIGTAAKTDAAIPASSTVFTSGVFVSDNGRIRAAQLPR